MNCVAVPPSEDKRKTTSSNAPSDATPPLHIIHSEVTLTSPMADGNTQQGSCSSPGSITNKSQSLQRTTTTHLYCRSLEKDANALAVSQRRTSNSRGFASCLRGERDDAFLDYQQRAIQYDMAMAGQTRQSGSCLQHHQSNEHYPMDENHPVQVLQTSMSSTGSGSHIESTTGRSK